MDRNICSTCTNRDRATVLFGTVALLLFTACEISAETKPALAKKSFQQKRLINQTLLRDSESRLRLTRFQELIRTENYINAVTLFQQIQNEKNDSFTWTDSGELISVKKWASKLFEQNPRLWKSYQKIYSGIAHQKYDPLKRETWKELSLRYFYTEAGFEAQKRLAASAWDHGQFENAARLFGELIHSPVHRKLVTPKLITQAYLSSQLAEDTSNQAELLNLLSTSTGSIPETKSRLDCLSQVLKKQLYKQKSNSDRTWAQNRQSNQLHLYAADTTAMLQPEWIFEKAVGSQNLKTECPHRTLQKSLSKWSNQQQDHLNPEITSLFAVAAQNMLIFRDFDKIRALQLQQTNEFAEGELRWEFQSPSPASTALKSHKDPYTGITSNHPNIERLLLGNSVTGTLSTDNHSVFFIDSIRRNRIPTEIMTASLEEISDSQTPQAEQPYEENFTNRLVAVPLNSNKNSVSIQWSIDRFGWNKFDQKHLLEHALAGHYFLGPPTLSHGVAYLVSEYESVISLSALESASGRLLWSQPISYTDKPLINDLCRATHLCQPVCAKGTILCDNGNGHLIAIDATSGKLIWLHCYADHDSRQDSGRWTYTQSTHLSQSGVVNVPIVLGDRVFLLPDRSSRIQCCSLQTGNLLWDAPRKRIQYLAAVSQLVTADKQMQLQLMCISNQSCQLLNPKSGEEIWKVKTGIVCGHGVQVGNVFLLPVDDGTTSVKSEQSAGNSTRGGIEAIDLATGKRSHSRFPAGNSQNILASKYSDPLAISGKQTKASLPGNLIVCNNRIVSIGINRITSYAQAGSVIKQAANRNTLPSEYELHQLAQAEVLTGDFDSAKNNLQQALCLQVQYPQQRKQTENLYREILYRELRSGSQNKRKILAEILKFSSTPEEQAFCFASEIELQLIQHNTDQLLSATIQFMEMGLRIPLPCEYSEQSLLTSSSCLPEIFRQLIQQMTSNQRESFTSQLEKTWLEKRNSYSNQQLEVIAEIFSDFPQVNPIRLELAQRYLDCGKAQQAELLFLKTKQSGSLAAQKNANRRLCLLYANLGLSPQPKITKKPQHSSRSPFQLVSFQATKKNRDNTKALPLENKVVTTPYISIKQHPSLTFIKKDPYHKRRSLLNNPQQNWALLHQSAPIEKANTLSLKNQPHLHFEEAITKTLCFNESSKQQLTLVNRQIGQEIFHLHLPGTRCKLSNLPQKQIGHLVPILSAGSLYGLSLIEGKPIWRWDCAVNRSENWRIELGPIGHNYCIYQTVREVVCLNPQTGHLLWKRTDLEPRGGLWANRNTGLIGDDKTLIYFHSNLNDYTVLDMRTGSHIKNGFLEQAPFLIQRTRKAFGRKLMYMAVTDTPPHDRYIRLWDPLQSELLIDQPFGIRDLYSASKEELTILSADGRLLIYQPAQEKQIANINVPLEDLGPINYLRVTQTEDIFLVNLYQTKPVSNQPGYASRFSDTPWNVTHINGPVIAVNKKTGKQQWLRTFSNRTIIDENLTNLPFVLMLAVYQNRPGDQTRTLLVEALDTKTGNTIQYQNDLTAERLLLLNHNQQTKQLVLSGLNNEIIINYAGKNLSHLKNRAPLVHTDRINNHKKYHKPR